MRRSALFSACFVGAWAVVWGCSSSSDGDPTPDPPGTVNPPSRYDHDSSAMNPASIDEGDASTADTAPPPPPVGTCIAQCTMEGDGGTPAQCMAKGGHCGDSPVHGGDDGGDGFLQCCLK